MAINLNNLIGTQTKRPSQAEQTNPENIKARGETRQLDVGESFQLDDLLQR